MKARTYLFCAVMIALISTQGFAQTPVSYQQNVVTAPDFVVDTIRVDLNGDGADDVITADFRTDGLQVFINNSDGTFRTAVHYAATPGLSPGFAKLVTGDFNNDGKADVALSTGNGTTIYLGKGDGTLSKLITYPFFAGQIGVADFNRDGKLDLALGGFQVAYGDGTGHFGAPKSVGFAPPTQSSPSAVLVGDFDADGKADIFVLQSTFARDGTATTFMTTFYGNGNGTFARVAETNGFNPMPNGSSVGDVDQDGKADVVIPVLACPAAGCTPGVRILYGSSTRNFSHRVLLNSTDDGKNAVIADVNGDGRQDVILRTAGQTQLLISYLQNANGSFTRQDFVIGTVAGGQDFSGPLVAGDFNRDRKPDLIMDRTEQNFSVKELLELINTTSSPGFPKCSPATPQGVNVCTPSGTVSSPAHFSIGAAASTPLRKIEVWVDGTKRKETFYSWANKSFMETDLTFATGTHQATVFAAGFDNRLLRKDFTFSVGSGSTCSQPANATGTVICSPANGSAVTNPVSVQARGGTSVNFMEVWVDGTKRFQTSGNSVSTTLTLAVGSHKMTVFGKNGSTVLSSAVSTFTVH